MVSIKKDWWWNLVNEPWHGISGGAARKCFKNEMRRKETFRLVFWKLIFTSWSRAAKNIFRFYRNYAFRFTFSILAVFRLLCLVINWDEKLFLRWTISENKRENSREVDLDGGWVEGPKIRFKCWWIYVDEEVQRLRHIANNESKKTIARKALQRRESKQLSKYLEWNIIYGILSSCSFSSTLICLLKGKLRFLTKVFLSLRKLSIFHSFLSLAFKSFSCRTDHQRRFR